MTTETDDLRMQLEAMKKENAIIKERAHATELALADAEQALADAEQNPEKSKIKKNIRKLRKDALKDGKELYYPNQKATALEVCESISNPDVVFIMVVAPCQSGKTGCMTAIIENQVTSESKVNPENIFVITGLSDKEWAKQTRSRIPLLDSNVIHRGQFNRSKHLLENIKNAVIIVDECHIACTDTQSLNKIFQQSGLKDLQYLKDNNINIVEFSATPNSTLEDLEQWSKCSKVHIMESGEGYKGHNDLIEHKRLYQAEDLFIDYDAECGLSKEAEIAHNKTIQPAKDAILNLKIKIEDTYKKSARYHIIRTPHKLKCETVIGRFKEIFGSDYSYKKCFGNEETLMDELAKYPEKHTLIFIKESARCAVSFLHKNLIGVLYERIPKKPNHSVIVQGLAGRACGYDVDDLMIVYSNVESIEKYNKMVSSKFINRDGFENLKKKKTHLHHSTYTNTDEEVSVINEDSKYILETEEFDNFDDAKQFIRALGGRGASKKILNKIDKDGFIMSSTSKKMVKLFYTHVKHEARSWSKTSLFDVNVKSKQKTYSRVIVCYKDLQDINSVCFIVRVLKAL
jgi:hypothetical protein